MVESVVFDVTCLARPSLTGVGNYALNLSGALKGLGCRLRYVHKGSRLGAAKKVKQWLSEKSHPYFKGVSDWHRNAQAIFHGPDFRLICSNKWRRVVTLHDLAVFHGQYTDPQFSDFAQGKLLGTLSASPEAIVMDSQFCADELLDRFPQVQGRVHVVGLGSDRLAGVEAEVVDLDRPFFLYVGTIEARKNVLNLVRAFEAFVAKNPDYLLVCVGGTGFGAEPALSAMQGLEQSGHLKRVGFISDAQLVYLYQQARGLVYPSFYEGFGLPIIEAMAMRCPVITSDRGAMAEVSAGCALLVDPYSEADISQAIDVLARSRPLEMIDKAKRHADQHTWFRSAQQMMAVYASMG